ncbi:tumor susceptibility gene 101 protein [Caerostris extrusa]|uniref:Tumor susceptibility gene 101 protein n=1 Tax=Caerostris extrusa TaxID=172846 RepID=A0AAV4SBC7_CAEEX|nr:tumor susceptibility gene 101 protein [Caerostris extrusa]
MFFPASTGNLSNSMGIVLLIIKIELEGNKMPQESIDGYVAKILSKYQYPDRAKRDVSNAIHRYKNLRPKLDTYVFNDGNRQELACLDGTIPVMYKETYYHIPTCRLKLHVMLILMGEFICHIYNWNSDSSDLLGVIQVMIIVFGEQPPVYAKPKLNSSAYTSTPYPAEPSSFMPMPNVGTTYPPYPPVPTAAQQPPYPAVSTAFPPYSGGYPAATGGYPSYGGMNTASGGLPATNSYPPTSTTPYPPTTASNLSQQSSTGTITQEHIHASLYSAVEDKVKKHLREVLAQSQAEMEVLKKTEEDLNKGKKQKLEDIINQAFKMEQVSQYF